MHPHSPLGTFAIIVKIVLFFVGFFLATAWILVTAMFSSVGKAVLRLFRRRSKNRE